MTPEIDQVLAEIQDLSAMERMIFEGYMVGSAPDQVKSALAMIKDDRQRLGKIKLGVPNE